MDMIRSATETTHALEERLPELISGKRRGKTWCGKSIEGRTGATIPLGIDCGSCLRIMRREGY